MELYEKFRPVILDVPFGDKEIVKSLGARWESVNKKWVVSNYELNEDLRKYINVSKIYIFISYDLKDKAKEKGARWDNATMKWYFLSCHSIPEEL